MTDQPRPDQTERDEIQDAADALEWSLLCQGYTHSEMYDAARRERSMER